MSDIDVLVATERLPDNPLSSLELLDERLGIAPNVELLTLTPGEVGRRALKGTRLLLGVGKVHRDA